VTRSNDYLLSRNLPNWGKKTETGEKDKRLLVLKAGGGKTIDSCYHWGKRKGRFRKRKKSLSQRKKADASHEEGNDTLSYLETLITKKTKGKKR